MNSVITAVRESNVHDKMLFSHSVMSDSIATPWTRWSAPGSCVYGISQAGILEWVAVPFSRGSSQPRDRTQVSHSAGGFLISWATREVPWYRSSFLRTFLDKVLSDHTSGPIYNYTTILKTKVELKVCNSQGGGRAYIFFLTEVQLIYNFVLLSFWCIVKWFSSIYIYILFHILFYYGLLQDIEYSFLRYTVEVCCLSILYIVVYIC